MSNELQRLRDLLAVADADGQVRIETRVDQVEQRLDDLPSSLPETIDAAEAQGPALSAALRQPLQRSLEQLARERRELLAEAIFPVIGPAIRRSITEALRELVLNLNRLMESAFTVRGLRWRLRAWRSGVPYAQVALRELLRYSVDHLFLVQNGSGLLLASARQPHAGNGSDSDAVAAMLTAIRDFSRDAGLAPGDAELSGVTLGEHLIRLYAGPQAYLAAAISGVPGDSVDDSLADLLERTHLHHEAELQAGEPTPALQTLLEQWMMGSGAAQALQEPDEDRKTPWMGLLLVGAIALLLALWLGERVWTGWQGERLQAGLQQLPGYQVTVQRSGWRQLRIEGLRDPLASGAEQALSASGFSGAVLWQTRPYLALDDELQLQRLQAALAAPETVSLSLRQGLLQMQGVATPDWQAQAQARLRAWPGLRGVDDQLQLPAPAVEPLPQRWEIHFAPDADRCDDAGVFDAVAAAWKASPQQSLQIIAETDGTGGSQANQALAEARASWAREQLLQRGLPESALKPPRYRPEVVSGDNADHRRVVLRLQPAPEEPSR